MPGPLISIIVPVLDEARVLPALLDHLAALDGRWEVVIADGGSRHASAEIAATHPAGPRVVTTRRGRAWQQNAGAQAATGDVFVFLHADTRLPAGAYPSLTRALADPGVIGGNFALRFDGGDRFSQLLGAWYTLQRRAGIYCGDSAIWLHRDAFDRLGGFRPLQVM